MIRLYKSLFFISLLLSAGNSYAQEALFHSAFSHQDSLRGSNGMGRIYWDVLKYTITVTPDFETKTITGINKIDFIDSGSTVIQIDLQEPMFIDSVKNNKSHYTFNREGNVYWVTLRSNKTNRFQPYKRSLTFFFHGKPKEAVNPPWDGGWIWKKDIHGNPWMSVACQGLGASIWYPCKDIQSDEPNNGAVLRIIVPDSLIGIGNGKLKEKKAFGKGKMLYTWQVVSPINNYNIVPYIGKYVHFMDNYKGLNGPLSMDYWVLNDHLEKAKKQFADAPRMMKAFEYWFGPYPFYADGYKLVEAPHLGMEHQSATAYGNKFKNGYLGRDLSGSGWGLKWDFIIVHESGHEWFANNITTNDIADMWVHEGFTNYSEVLFTEYYYGKEAGNDYAIGLRKNIQNDVPIIAPYGVNKEGSGDMYYKGANMIHLIRQVISDDDKFRNILIGLNKKFFHKTVNTADIEDYINKESGKDFSKVFDQYLRTVKIPQLEYAFQNNQLKYRYANTVEGFTLPIKITIGKTNQPVWITPTKDWQIIQINGEETISIDRNFYVNLQKVEE